MYETALLIYNGNAGQKEVDKTLSQIIGPLSASIPTLTLMQTQKPGDAERFCRQHGEEVDIVIVLGGDGTVHECVNGLSPLDRRPAFSILPAGTCNDFARALEIPLNIKQAAELIISPDSRERRIDIAQTNDRYFSNFWGTGLIAEASQNIDEQSKGLLGRFSYYISAFKTLSGQEMFSFTLESGDQTIEDEAVMLIVLNGKFLGATQFPLSSIQLDDGLMDIMVIKESGFPLLKEILSAKTTVNWEKDQSTIDHFQASSIKIKTSSKRVIDMDGEHYEGDYQKITILPGHLKIVAPNLKAETGV
ncbi:YegS/Rv2252/BmrU family lipid kinase [Jeotgalibacillus sp. S-D1]|uniref:diacylglycerol/lipid kinase family protein n=1 Tax=Jeotgalibacillus sp. S-D1 TaxID=2552189 RepID=UPI0010596C2A|nr:YegS/Rv2252/BmrU family lipid kinase [Jeotgalibacillus sp. S-D1]TDL30474.1 YegS/Rv2252/BmrU family lipid kinase [Jeotgalibacillus sp. S-D1]